MSVFPVLSHRPNIRPHRLAVRLRHAVIAVLVSMMAAGTAQAGSASHLQISRNAYGATQYIEVGLNKSVIVDLPAQAGEVIVSDPNTASAIMRSRSRAIVQGKAPGETNIFFLDPNGGRISVLEVTVVQDSSGLETTISRLIPGSRIRAETVSGGGGTRVVLSGTANSTEDMNKALAIAAQYAGGEANVANVISVAGAQQVALKVTVAEVNREVVKQLGINLSGSASAGVLTATFNNSPGLGGASNVLPSASATGSGNFGGFSLQAQLRALERKGAVRTLAEPTLTALSGQEAEFLAGGEYPVPAGVSDGVVTFEFKQFGANLKFTPTIMSNGLIGLDVETSVSEPTTSGGFTLSGVTIPATKERTARTSVQLQSGSTLAIAGLIQDSVRQQFNSIPGIGDVPILGALFRSRDFIHSQTELVILVTPVLADSSYQGPLPTEKMQFASDAEAIFLGRMERLYGVGTCQDTCDASAGGGLRGSVGFVLD